MATRSKKTEKVETQTEAAPKAKAVPAEVAVAPEPVVAQTPITNIEALAPSSSATTALAQVADEDDFGDMGSDAERLTSDDLLISRYRVVQGTTKAKKGNPSIKDGRFYNTSTKMGYEQGLVVALHEVHHIVERTTGDDGKFIGTLGLKDPRVLKARKANGDSLIKLLTVDREPANKLVETRDVHVAFLADDGVSVTGFGVLQFDSSNLMPGKTWKNERAMCCAPTAKYPKGRPPYAFRAVIRGDGVKDNSGINKADSALWVIKPWGDQGNWEQGALKMSVPAERELLLKLQAHTKLVKEGLVKVDYREDEGEPDETTAEDASFDPDDDGRAPAAGASTGTFDPEDM
jgi:hypothetical protein